MLSGFFSGFANAGGEMLVNNGYVDEGLLAGLENIANGGADYDGVPKAYLNYIVFDNDYNVIEGKKLQISEAGKFTVGNETVGSHEYLQIAPITISEEGYVYIYLSNQTPNSEVYFDDLYIKHTKSRVIQKEDYYPFGLQISALSTRRESMVAQKWKFQGQEHQTDFDLNWYAFKWRNHQPDIGRFFNVDPLADKYVYNSPYAFSENKVVAHVELEGLEAMPFGLYLDLVNWAVGKAEQKMEKQAYRNRRRR